MGLVLRLRLKLHFNQSILNCCTCIKSAVSLMPRFGLGMRLDYVMFPLCHASQGNLLLFSEALEKNEVRSILCIRRVSSMWRYLALSTIENQSSVNNIECLFGCTWLKGKTQNHSFCIISDKRRVTNAWECCKQKSSLPVKQIWCGWELNLVIWRFGGQVWNRQIKICQYYFVHNA